jgi:hypothetical protein
MTRKLTLLNVLLAAGIVTGAWKISQDYRAERLKHDSFFQQQPASPTVPVFQPEERPQAVQAANYLPVADLMLFSRDRNSEVIIEETPPEEKPVPPFPSAFGMVGWGGDVTVILGVNGAQKGFRVGDNVGDFKLAAVTANDLTFEWDGQQFKKTFEELKQKSEPPQQAPQRAAGQAAGGTNAVSAARVISDPKEAAEATRARMASEAKGKRTDPEVARKLLRPKSGGGPGLEGGGSNRLCDPADRSPSGTEQGGFRKVVVSSPFGQTCRWEPVRR